jgi:8-amino-7-oxononanoate synthase
LKTSFCAEEWPTATSAIVDGKSVVMFSGCNYLGLSHHPEVLARAQAGFARYGIAANGSPLTTGRVRAHELLEARLAQFVGLPSASLLPDGHLANVAACQAVASTLAAAQQKQSPVALVDATAHDSLQAAARAAGFTVHRFQHADAADAARLCHELAAGSALVLTDSIFGARGEHAPVRELLTQLPASATLLLDDCHGLGVLGPTGQGCLAAAYDTDWAPVNPPRVIVTASLSKGLGCYGGVVAADRALIDALRSGSGAYGGTTPIPPAIADAALAALDVLQRDGKLISALRRNAACVRAGLAGLGQPVPPEGVPVFCLVLAPEIARDLEQRFAHDGLGVPFVSYANGPSQRYFRIAISALHTEAELERLLTALGAVLAR